MMEEPIAVGRFNTTGVANIHEIVGNINRSIIILQDAGHEHMAEILKEIGRAAIMDPVLKKRVCQATIESLRTLAWEASLPCAQRHLGIVRAALEYIPVLLSDSLDVLNYYRVHLDDLREFFGISK